MSVNKNTPIVYFRLKLSKGGHNDQIYVRNHALGHHLLIGDTVFLWRNPTYKLTEQSLEVRDRWWNWLQLFIELNPLDAMSYSNEDLAELIKKLEALGWKMSTLDLD